MLKKEQIDGISLEPSAWFYWGRWVQPPVSAGFWSYWHHTSSVRELFPDYSFHTLMQMNGHFWMARQDIDYFKKKINALATGAAILQFAQQFETICEKYKKAHLAIIDGIDKKPEHYLPKLFKTYKDVTSIWTISPYLADEISALALSKNYASHEQELLENMKPFLRENLLETQNKRMRVIAEVILKKYPTVSPATIETTIAHDANLKRTVEQFVNEFAWFGTHHWMGEPFTFEKCIDELKASISKKEKSDEMSKTKIVQRDGKENDLWKALALLTYWRTHIAEICAKVVFASRPVLETFGKTLHLTYDELIYLSPAEIEQVLVGKPLPDYKKIIAERKNGFGNYVDKEGEHFLVGNEMNYIIERLLKVEDVSASEIKGTVASRGEKLRGIARIIISPADFSSFREGDILVAPETTPDFVPLMKKALAIVTDKGGITSHAAIVSRELKKPCIIGTRIATRALKDGDLIEVDADKGIVRKLK